MPRLFLETNRSNAKNEILGYALLDKHGLADWRISFENLRNVKYAPQRR
jgi:hypothetical protein